MPSGSTLIVRRGLSIGSPLRDGKGQRSVIIFQITLTGAMLQFLAHLHQQEVNGDPEYIHQLTMRNFITVSHSLERQGLITHESHIKPYSPGDEPPTFATPGRRFHYELTDKGRAALQLAACDLKDFLADIGVVLDKPTAPTPLAAPKRNGKKEKVS